MAKKDDSGTEAVEAFFAGLDHPLKDGLIELREIILSSDKSITEHIKWNGPSFCYEGIDRITTNIHRDQILIVLHRGAKVKDNSDFRFEDPSGLVEWASADRGVVKLKANEDVQPNSVKLKRLVKAWIKSN